MLSQQPTHFAFHYAWFEQAVFGLDRWLRQRQGVLEYTDDPQCLFRIQRTAAEAPVMLRDGTQISAGDAVLNLHLWNEQFPSMGADGATMRWARAVASGIDLSLRELAQHMRWTRDLDDVVALRADMRLGTTEQCRQLARISSRYGFEEACATVEESSSFHRLGENIFLVMLVLATNPAAMRHPVLWRDHTLVYLSRSSLEQRYARAKRSSTRGAVVC